MVSDGSCDTERFIVFLIKNAALVSIRDFFQKHKKIYIIPTFWLIVYIKLAH